MYRIATLILFMFSAAAHSDEHSDCGNNEQAIALSKLIKADTKQRRTKIQCNKLLTDIAKAKAIKMAEFGLVTHNLGGSPNSHLRRLGYELPKHYGGDFGSNQVEAIAGGYSTAQEVWQAFKSSDAHRSHLLGEHEFYLEQDEIGVAFIKEWQSPHVEYWVVYLTKGYAKAQKYSGDTDDIPNKNSYIMTNDTIDD